MEGSIAVVDRLDGRGCQGCGLVPRGRRRCCKQRATGTEPLPRRQTEGRARGAHRFSGGGCALRPAAGRVRDHGLAGSDEAPPTAVAAGPHSIRVGGGGVTKDRPEQRNSRGGDEMISRCFHVCLLYTSDAADDM
eukprot:6036514-Prymnesium_polylepis.1